MCDPISGMLLAATIASSFGSAYINSAKAKQEAIIQQRQLKTDIENEKIKAMGETNDRLEQFRKDEAANRAALSAMNFDNLSYREGIAPENREVVRRDVRRLEFNSGQEIGRKKYEIAVAGWRSKSESRVNYLNAGFETIGTLSSAHSNRGGQPNATYQPQYTR